MDLPANPEAAHRPPAQLHQNLGDRRIAFGEREEFQIAQSTQHLQLSDAYASFNFCFVFRMIRPCRQYADTVMCSHGDVLEHKRVGQVMRSDNRYRKSAIVTPGEEAGARGALRKVTLATIAEL